MRLEWLESFELGYKAIDEDHRKMLSLMKQIEAAMLAGNLDRGAALLDDLLHFSEMHFKREERLLREIHYPSADLHKNYHAELLLRAYAVKDACKAITSADVFRECCEEMIGFLIDDIVGGDLKIKSFLQEIGLTSRR